MDWHPDGGILAAASADGLTLYDEALQIATQLYAGETVYSLSWNPDGTQLAVTHANNLDIYEWDGTNLGLLTSLVGDNPQINVLWSPDGHYIIGNTDIYDTVDNSFLGYFSRPPVEGMGGVEWHPDGWRIAIGYQDGTIRIEDATLLPGFQVMSYQSTQAGDLD